MVGWKQGGKGEAKKEFTYKRGKLYLMLSIDVPKVELLVENQKSLICKKHM